MVYSGLFRKTEGREGGRGGREGVEQSVVSGQPSPGLRRGRGLGTGPLEKLPHWGQGVGLFTPELVTGQGGGAVGVGDIILQALGQHGGHSGAGRAPGSQYVGGPT